MYCVTIHLCKEKVVNTSRKSKTQPGSLKHKQDVTDTNRKSETQTGSRKAQTGTLVTETGSSEPNEQEVAMLLTSRSASLAQDAGGGPGGRDGQKERRDRGAAEGEEEGARQERRGARAGFLQVSLPSANRQSNNYFSKPETHPKKNQYYFGAIL